MVVAAAVLGVVTCKNLLYPLDYENIVTKYSQEYELDPHLVMAIIKAESNFIEDAHSGKASGLMQLTDDTADWVAQQLGKDADEIELNNPRDNIELGCYYIRYLIDYYEGNVDVALAAYNGGMGNVDKWLENKKYSDDGKTLKNIPFKETREYVKKVNAEKEVYQKMMSKEARLGQ